MKLMFLPWCVSKDICIKGACQGTPEIYHQSKGTVISPEKKQVQVCMHPWMIVYRISMDTKMQGYSSPSYQIA
jgi:hypothetical protein